MDVRNTKVENAQLTFHDLTLELTFGGLDRRQTGAV